MYVHLEGLHVTSPHKIILRAVELNVMNVESVGSFDWMWRSESKRMRRKNATAATCHRSHHTCNFRANRLTRNQLVAAPISSQPFAEHPIYGVFEGLRTTRPLNASSKARSGPVGRLSKTKPKSIVIILPSLTRNTTSAIPLLRSLLIRLRLASHEQMAVAGAWLKMSSRSLEALTLRTSPSPLQVMLMTRQIYEIRLTFPTALGTRKTHPVCGQ